MVGKTGGKGTVPKVGSEIMCEGGSASAEVPHNQSHGSVTLVLTSFCRALENQLQALTSDPGFCVVACLPREVTSSSYVAFSCFKLTSSWWMLII